MEINDMRSAVTLISFALFIGIAVWTWRRARRDAFDEAARLPFADDASNGEQQ